MDPFATTISFVDDRIITAATSADLDAAWECSARWDQVHGWEVNATNSAAFAIGLPKPVLALA